MQARLSPASRSAAACCALVLGLLIERPTFAHGTGAHPTPTPTASPKPISHGAKLLKSVSSIRKIQGTSGSGLKGKAELVNQVYSDETQRKYLLIDADVRIPNSSLGIEAKAKAGDTKLTLRYFHDGDSSAYAECSLELRKSTKRLATYSLGMKDTSADILVRWGHCDDPHSPGFDLIFPHSQLGDTITLSDADGKVLARFESPVSLDVTMPAKKKRQPKPAVVRLMETGPYQTDKK